MAAAPALVSLSIARYAVPGGPAGGSPRPVQVVTSVAPRLFARVRNVGSTRCYVGVDSSVSPGVVVQPGEEFTTTDPAEMWASSLGVGTIVTVEEQYP